MAAAFPEINRVMRRTPGIDSDLSGSTGVVAMVVGATGKVVVGNLGDSRAVLGESAAWPRAGRLGERPGWY